jgi:hypothetical protein
VKRARLTESFHGEGNIEAIENLTASGNETLQVKITNGTLTFLTSSNEGDEAAMRHARFVVGELQMENAEVFNFWLADEGRGGFTETAVYPATVPQTG